jgi:hypothetical protein
MCRKLPPDGDRLIRIEAVLLPLIFVGMGLLLFGIGMHLHLMHVNYPPLLPRR